MTNPTMLYLADAQTHFGFIKLAKPLFLAVVQEVPTWSRFILWQKYALLSENEFGILFLASVV